MRPAQRDALIRRSKLRRLMPSAGASVIQCCYAATGSLELSAFTNKVDSENRNVTFRNGKKCDFKEKISLNVSRLVTNPACIAGVRISGPNFSAL